SNLPTTSSGITAAAAVAAAAAAAATAAAGGGSVLRWPSSRGSPRSSFNSGGSGARRPVTPNQSRLSSNNVQGNIVIAAGGVGSQSTVLPPLGPQQGRPAGSILDTVILPSPPGSAAGDRRPSRMQTMTRAAPMVSAIFETLPQLGFGADGASSGGGAAASGILFPPTSLGGPLLDGDRLGQLTRLTTDAASVAASVANLLAPPKPTQGGPAVAAAVAGGNVAGAAAGADGSSALPGAATSVNKDAQTKQQPKGGDGALGPLFESAVSDEE
ncbi:hypothetical protein VaNZ11_002169, partial [Volvox africanus]